MTIWLEERNYDLRLIKGSKDEKPPPEAVASLFRFEDTAIVTGLHGKITKKDVVEFYDILYKDGIKYLIGQRVGGGAIPLGKPIGDNCPFSGWILVDLEKLFNK